MTDPNETTEPAASAAARLEAGVDELHVPEPSADAEARLLQLGVLLPILGLILIGIAWYNASGSAYVADQIPMLISGGVLGLGLAMVGVGLYIRFSLARLLRFWMARWVIEQQAQTDRIVEALGRIEQGLGGQGPGGAAAGESVGDTVPAPRTSAIATPMGEPVESISAITLATAEMARSVRFYESLGFARLTGGPDAPFSTFRAGPGFVNLQLDPDAAPGGRIWGRVIFWVDDVDAMYERALAAGHEPEMAPSDAPWGERYFHLRDPDGHELSFARVLGR